MSCYRSPGSMKHLKDHLPIKTSKGPFFYRRPENYPLYRSNPNGLISIIIYTYTWSFEPFFETFDIFLKLFRPFSEAFERLSLFIGELKEVFLKWGLHKRAEACSLYRPAEGCLSIDEIRQGVSLCSRSETGSL